MWKSCESGCGCNNLQYRCESNSSNLESVQAHASSFYIKTCQLGTNQLYVETCGNQSKIDKLHIEVKELHENFKREKQHGQ